MFVELSNELISDETKYLVYFYNLEEETCNNAFLLIFHGGYVNRGDSYSRQWYLMRMEKCSQSSSEEDAIICFCPKNTSDTKCVGIFSPHQSIH